MDPAIEKGLDEKKRKLHGQMDRVLKYWVSHLSVCFLCSYRSVHPSPLQFLFTFQQREDPKKAHDIKQCVVLVMVASIIQLFFFFFLPPRLIVDSEGKRRRLALVYSELGWEGRDGQK